MKRPSSSMELVEGIVNKVEWVEGDILDTSFLEEAFQDVEKVYHCAAVVSFNHKDAALMMKINREGTANVVNIALALGVKKLIHVSSIAAIGRSKSEAIINEESKWIESNSNSPYGISKHLAEMEVYRGIAEGLNAAIVNPSNILGSGFWRGRTSTGQLFYKVWKGMPFYPVGSTGFVDVRDVVRFMYLLMESEKSNERYILNGENLPFKKVFDSMAEALNAKKPYIEVTPIVRELAWRGSWVLSKITGRPPFVTKQTARYSAGNYFYENTKSLDAFPFIYSPLKKTIEETGKQFLQSVDNGFKPMLLPID